MSNPSPTNPPLPPKSDKRTPTPKRKGYLWDGLLNPSVFITYALEIGFLLVLSVVNLP